ncbi:hypothetical protein U1Q18_007883 [Sarracenia purpurea var. burkii]
MADASVADPIPPIPNPTTTADLDSLPIPPLDPAFFSGVFISDPGSPFNGDVDDLDFTFDDFYLPSDTEDFLNSLPDTNVPLASDGLHFSSDPTPDVTRGLDYGGFDHISGDQSSSGARVLNSPSPGSCQVSGDCSLDGAKFLNVSSPESSQEYVNNDSDFDRVLNYPSSESETHSREVCGRASSPVSGNSCNRLEASSPNSANNSINGGVDQKIKLEKEGSNCMLKRKKESEDVSTESRTSKYRRSNSVDIGSAPYSLDTTCEEEEKRKARLMRNRESAQLSRQRKKHYVDELEDKVRIMHSTIQDLNSKISYIMAENASLRQQLGPSLPPLGICQHPPMAPIAYPWMPCPPYLVKPQGSQVPLIPIPRLKTKQTSPAPKAKKVESKNTLGKTKKVASVSFLGFLFFILLFGGLVPIINLRFDGRASVSGGSNYLGKKFYEQNQGRVLAVNGHLNGSDQNIDTGSHPFPGSDNSSEPLVASLYVPRNDKLVKIDGNLIIHSVLASEKAMASRQNHGTKSSKETGLAVAGNMRPSIPLTVRNTERHPHLYGRQRALGSGSADDDNLKAKSANGKLQQWFQEGLAGPLLSSGMCTEVFQFDVLPTPGAIVSATSVMNGSAQHRHNATHVAKGRNRRILHGVPIPLPGSRNESTKQHVERSTKRDSVGGNNSLSSMVVSVLVDPREAGDGEIDGVMGPKSLSRIFVVVLIDSVKYVSYSCMLPLMGSGAHLVTA